MLRQVGTSSAFRKSCLRCESASTSTSWLGSSLGSWAAFSLYLTFKKPGSRGIHGSTKVLQRPLAFAFDIDGVLKQGPNVLPAALRALKILEGENSRKSKIPYLFITNGGGYDEADRANRLSQELQVQVDEDQVIQAHTVLSSLVKLYGSKPVLVIGPNSSRRIMNKYGFQDVYTANDLHAHSPSAWPFSRPIDSPKVETRQADLSKVNFAAVMVFHDSRDWGRDAQLIIDILRAKDGVFGTLDDNLGKPGHQQLPLYFSHNDLLWGNDFSVSRFGQGAFRAAIEHVWLQTTGQPLMSTAFGKPSTLTYEFADALLKQRLKQMIGEADAEQATCYMLGDNPQSDIAGANAFGWKSALVRTGVYRDAEGPPKHTPTFIVDDVEAAVKEAIRREWGQEP